MATKKKKKNKKRTLSVENGIPKITEEEKVVDTPEDNKEEASEIVEVPVTCTMVGQKVSASGEFVGVVKKQRYIDSLKMLLVYIDSEDGKVTDYCCNAHVCKILKGDT